MGDKAERDQAEYNRLVADKSRAQSDYQQCENRIEDCEYLLSRLYKAKGTISGLKSSFKVIKNIDKNTGKESYDWKGSNKSTFDSYMDTLNGVNDTYYKGSLDYVLDQLNNEITRLENKKMSEYGLLGKLGSLLNSLGNKIENFFN